MRQDGTVVTKPSELAEYELVDSLCQRWGCTPSQLLHEDADYILQMVAVLTLAAPEEPEMSYGEQ